MDSFSEEEFAAVELDAPFLQVMGDLYIIGVWNTVLPCCKRKGVQIQLVFNFKNKWGIRHSSAKVGWNVEHSLQRNYDQFYRDMVDNGTYFPVFPCKCATKQ